MQRQKDLDRQQDFLRKLRELLLGYGAYIQADSDSPYTEGETLRVKWQQDRGQPITTLLTVEGWSLDAHDIPEQSDPVPTTPVCMGCGSADVYAVYQARWDRDTHDWTRLELQPESPHCGSCGADSITCTWEQP